MITFSDGHLLTTFVTVARNGSFTSAASALHVSKSVVSGRIRELETRAGVPLFERTTRRVRLTDAGRELLDVSVVCSDALRRVSEGLDNSASAPGGRLRVSTTNDLAASFVGPAVARFVNLFTGVTVEIVADDHAHDLVEAGVDIAVRLGEPRGASYSVRRLATADEPIVAAPVIAARLRSATRPRDLADAPWVRHTILGKSRLRFVGPGATTEEISPSFRAEANTGLAVLGLLLAGAGVGVLPDYMLREHLSTGRLVRLCAPWVWKRVALFILAPPRAKLRPIHRHFTDVLREQLVLDEARWGARQP